MIIYDGFEIIQGQSFIKFKNEKGYSLSIPIEQNIIDYMTFHFNRIEPETLSPLEVAFESE
jgi:hypothetical protein